MTLENEQHYKYTVREYNGDLETMEEWLNDWSSKGYRVIETLRKDFAVSHHDGKAVWYLCCLFERLTLIQQPIAPDPPPPPNDPGWTSSI